MKNDENKLFELESAFATKEEKKNANKNRREKET